MQIAKVPRADEFIEIIRGRLGAHTVNHCISATELMLSIADTVGVTESQCAQAGLLHDYSKNLDGEELLATAMRYGLPVSGLHQRKPKLLHGSVAAEEVRRVLGITDEDVLDAIRCHTTGRPGMCKTALALYFADFSEPLRTHPEAAEARAILAADGFGPALKYVSGKKLNHVLTKTVVDPSTLAFHNWLQRQEYPS